ncbi:uncharacterized protein LOC110437513 [Sorghum bicolor]|uniref:uncharacterized protein LOC110437513 n=1 Tax=Sorghum bicolor TaxID=4558 RepID=UPI000B424A7C|nr:uncharacterized protein LOC110437513 [Sorghum bicolor]|eukprot:XP_021321657.1 uncharacterized protein LOC110437513 [Sorghum bicolor]
MTHEVWLSLIGLNLDLWNHALVDKAMSVFGKLILWEEDYLNMGRVFVRARVSGLDSTPWFFTFSEGLDPSADSWTVQCEIFQATLIGDLPQDEDIPPRPDANDDAFQPNNFAYFGYGQPSQGPPMPTPSFQPFNPFAVLNPNPQNLNAFGWDEWPNVMPANEAQFLPEADPVPQLIEPEPPLLPVEPVQIVEFPNFENLQPLVPEEVDYNDLLGYVNPPVNEGNGNLHIEENLHVGFAQFYQPAAKNMWMNPLVFKPSPEALRQWSPSFDWAKHFLQSPAWDYFSKAAPGNSTIFQLPVSSPADSLQTCPSSVIIEDLTNVCVSGVEQEDIPESTVQAQAKRMPRKGKKPILSEADVRRSLRIKKLHKGFKLQTYKDKNCLGCSSTPPEISPSLIRNLDASFCDINPEDLSDVNLHAKPSPSQPVNKKSKQVKKKDSKAPKKDGDK